MTNRSQRLAAYLGCGCALLLAACGNASGSNPPSTHSSKLVRAPWSQIAHARHHPMTLLINTDQDTADRSTPCFTHYTTRVVTETSHRISIELPAPNTEGRSFQCTAPPEPRAHAGTAAPRPDDLARPAGGQQPSQREAHSTYSRDHGSRHKCSTGTATPYADAPRGWPPSRVAVSSVDRGRGVSSALARCGIEGTKL